VGAPYLASTKDKSGPGYPEKLKRLYLCGHSGGGKPMTECAAANWVMTNKVPGGSKVPCDFWLFDATYWSQTANFIALCKAWSDAKTLGNGASQNRFICIFGPTREKKLEWLDDKATKPALDAAGKQKWHWEGTEVVADDMRDEIFKKLFKDKLSSSKDLWLQHTVKTAKTVDNMNSDIIPALRKNPLLFIRTPVQHEDIPTTFIPVLLWTAAS
jgi:hypothetical protein